MKINLEVLYSCTIKRKKPWPKTSWIGKQKEQLFILDNQRISILDAKNGKTKKKVSKVSQLFKTVINYSISDNGLYLVGILNTGDLFIWNRDAETIQNISGITEFSFKLGFNLPSVFISDDTKKILLVTSRNKIFVWETEKPNHSNKDLNGNWSDIIPSKEIKTVEDNKELCLHARFNSNQFEGLSATCCFVFNYDNKIIVNVLKIKWLNQSEIVHQKQCRFETIWISHQPTFLNLRHNFSLNESKDLLIENKFSFLYTRGAYVIKLSHSTDILALACNQKYVERNCLVFMSPFNGSLTHVNLRNFGLNIQARGRHYWIQDLNWMFNDLYLAGITKHGAIFLVSRLGHPLLIHAMGKEINMGPALYLTLHPLIIVRGKSGASVSQNSLSSTLENEDNLRQRYSICRHPYLPIFACSDGYLLCVFRLQTAFSTQSRLIRELMHETIGLLNSVSEMTGHENYLNNSFYSQKETKIKHSLSKNNLNDEIPNWDINGINTEHSHTGGGTIESDKSGSDSGVDSNDGNNKNSKNRGRSDSFGNQKIAEGKIIFSFLPQILPISDEILNNSSIASKMEYAFEHLQSSWSLLVSMPTIEASNDTYECDQIATAIQQAFTHFSYLFLTMDSVNLKNFQIYKNELMPTLAKKLDATNHTLANESDISIERKNILELKYEEEFKIKVLVDFFMRFLKTLYFDPASKYNPNSHMIIYLPKFVEKFIQSLLKFENIFVNESFYSVSRTNLFGLIYTLLNFCEKQIKQIYNFKQDERFFLNVNRIVTSKEISRDDLNTTKPKSLVMEQSLIKTEDQSINPQNNQSKPESDEIETDSLDKQDKQNQVTLLVKQNQSDNIEFNDLLFEKCWLNLMHYTNKYRKSLGILGQIRDKQLRDLDLFILLLERRIQKFPYQNRIYLESNDTNECTHNDFHAKICKPIYSKSHLFKINKADLIYLDYGNVDIAIDEWLIQINILFEQINYHSTALISTKSKKNSNLAKLIHKSIKIAHKIFYACLENYNLKRLIDIINRFFIEKFIDPADDDYSPFNLSISTFKFLQPPKPLKKTHVAIVCIIKSLARFMALYLSDKRPLFIYSVNNPFMMPNLIDELNPEVNTNQIIKIELSREKLTCALNQQKHASFFTADKALELLIVTGLFDEAIYFLNLINDWKSSFLIGSILKESEYCENENYLSKLPSEMQCEKALSTKLCSLLGIDKMELNKNINTVKIESIYSKLMEKNQTDSVTPILKELLLCSVMTRANVLESLLNYMMEILVQNITQLNKNSVIVPDDFYLPAPPIYCAQMNSGEIEPFKTSTNLESNLRIKLSVLCKCIIVLLASSNLHVPLIKWYLEQLVLASQQMKQNYGIHNSFKLDLSLNNLLTSIRYQKLGYIPENILYIFRDFCALLFYIDLRDRFSLALRQYSKYFIQNQAINYDETNSSSHSSLLIELSLKIIDYGNMMLSFRSFLGDQHIEIQDIILSTISRLTNLNQFSQFGDLNLEQKLAVCVEKKPYTLIETYKLNNSINEKVENLQFNMENLNNKLKKLLESWKQIRSQNHVLNNDENTYLSMSDVFEHHILINERSSNAKLVSLYGLGEDSLPLIYMEKLDRTYPSVCGGFDFERCYWYAEFLELFFKLGFDQTEDWDHLIQSINQTPLLPEFYDIIRSQELPISNEFVDKQYLIKPYLLNELDRKQKTKEVDYDKISPLMSRKRRSTNINQAHTPLDIKKQLNRSIIEELNIDFPLALSRKKGLFRTYSVKSLNNSINSKLSSQNIDDYKLRKSVSFSDIYDTQNINSEYLSLLTRESNFQQSQQSDNGIELRNDQPLKSLDYGSKYIQTTNLAIWLMKWSFKFHRILMANNKAAGSFWYDSLGNEKNRSSITLKLNSLNANLLVGCVYMADGNNLEASAVSSSKKKVSSFKKLTKKRAETVIDDDLTQITSSSLSENIPIEKKKIEHKPKKVTEKKSTNANIEETSQSSTLDISSITENQIKNYFNPSEKQQLESFVKQSSIVKMRPQSKSPSKSPIKLALNKTNDSINLDKSSMIEASEFYNLTNVKQSKISNNIEKPPSGDQIKNLDSIKSDDLNKSTKSVRMGSFEFLTNMFGKSKSRSPSRSPSKSLTIESTQKQPNTNQYSKNLEQNNILNLVDNNSSPAINNVQDIIRNELKKIVQMQHDTVMNFLNYGSTSNNNVQQMSLPQNLDQQLISVLKQQKLVQKQNDEAPVEFIIETKIKTIDSSTGQPNSVSSIFSSNINNNQLQKPLGDLRSSNENKNYFMKTFDNTNEINHSSQHNSRKKQSNLIRIPLLNINHSGDHHEANIRETSYLPQIENNNFTPRSKYDLSPPTKHKPNFPLLDFKAEKRNSSQTKLLNIDSNSSENLNKHVKDFIQVNRNHAMTNYKNFPLLKLNYESKRKEVKVENETIKSIDLEPKQQIQDESKTPIIDSANINKIPERNEQIKESKEVQVQKPMYDGYILAPGIFDDMLNNVNEKISATNAQAHYNSTKHLREEEMAEDKKNKKSIYTMTDGLSNAHPIAPDILFKLHFDSKRKDREQMNDTIGDAKDYVNVVDLDGDAVNDLLKLIEYEQNKREGKFVSIEPKKNKQTKIEKDEAVIDTNEIKNSDLIPKKDIEVDMSLKGDSLTELLLLERSKEEWKEYDEIMQKNIEESNKKASISIGKQKAFNELIFIDEKIKLMNEMASQMNNDYTKYNKILTTVQDLAKQREEIEKYQEKQLIEEEQKKIIEKRRQEAADKIKFYERKEADNQVKDLKKKIIIKPRPSPRNKKIIESKSVKKPYQENEEFDKDDDLSDLKVNEEAKLKKILNADTRMSLSMTGDSQKGDHSMSVTNILQDVFDDLNVNTVDDLDSDKLDQILNEYDNKKNEKATSIKSSIRPTKQKVKPNQFSQIRSRKETSSIKKNIHSSISPKPLNKTYEKVDRKVSPIVTLEKEMEGRREILKEHHTYQRTEDAKKLLEDILVDSRDMKEYAKRNISPVSPMSVRKNKSRSPVKPSGSNTRNTFKSSFSNASLVPPLSLDQSRSKLDIATAEMTLENKKPSLMAQTMIELKKKEKFKQNETERLLKDLENRARTIVTKPTSKEIKNIKPFTSYVHLQEPKKLRDHPDHKPLTYGQQLKLHQEITVKPETAENNPYELFKLYGTRRVRGVYHKYEKTEPRRVKTYAERLRDLKPAHSQANIIKLNTLTGTSSSLSSFRQNNQQIKKRQTKTYSDQLKELQGNQSKINVTAETNGKHKLTTKARIDLNKKSYKSNGQRRFEPYKLPDNDLYDDKLDDLSSWSLDEKIKNIIYDETQKKSNIKPKKIPRVLPNAAQKKRVTIKDIDQDTLADTDADYLFENLLEEEKQNEKTFKNILNDLSNIERKEKELKGNSFLNQDEYDDDDDYVSQVNIDDLKNFSLSASESAISSFIDWDQIDQLVDTLK